MEKTVSKFYPVEKTIPMRIDFRSNPYNKALLKRYKALLRDQGKKIGFGAGLDFIDMVENVLLDSKIELPEGKKIKYG